MISMVGLSVILENCKDFSAKRKPQVVSKGSIIKLPSNPSSPKTPPPPNNNDFNNGFSSTNNNASCFLERCFLCQLKLLPGKDIYMYKGELGFCSEECRCRQIFMDEEETITSGSTIEYNCSLVATSSPSSSNGGGKSVGNNAFAY